MGQNPLNLALRFVLEVVALSAVGYWGWTFTASALRYLLAVGVPVLAATLWATLRVPDEPPGAGPVPIPVPGWVRLLLELALFAFAAWGLFMAGVTALAWIFSAVVLVHYAVSYDRVGWLLRH